MIQLATAVRNGRVKRMPDIASALSEPGSSRYAIALGAALERIRGVDAYADGQIDTPAFTEH